MPRRSYVLSFRVQYKVSATRTQLLVLCIVATCMTENLSQQRCETANNQWNDTKTQPSTKSRTLILLPWSSYQPANMPKSWHSESWTIVRHLPFTVRDEQTTYLPRDQGYNMVRLYLVAKVKWADVVSRKLPPKAETRGQELTSNKRVSKRSFSWNNPVSKVKVWVDFLFTTISI